MTLIVIASLLPVWMCVQTFFHPEDVLALWVRVCRQWRACAVTDGCWRSPALWPSFSAVRASCGGAPIRAGTGCQEVLLCDGRLRNRGHCGTSSRGDHVGARLRAVALGTGNHPFPGGTVLWETHASGVMAVLLFRVAPVVVSIVVSWWVARRLGSGALEPVALMSLVAGSLSLRLVFEVNWFSYYFMALAVTLALLEATQGSIRRTVGCVVGRVDPVDLPPLPRALRCQHVGGVSAERPRFALHWRLRTHGNPLPARSRRRPQEPVALGRRGSC